MEPVTDFTLWALDTNGRMHSLEGRRYAAALTSRLQKHLPPHTAALMVLVELLELLQDSSDPDAQRAVAWGHKQLACMAEITQDERKPQIRQYPRIITTTFGVCTLIGVGTVGHWIWRLVAYVL